MITRRGLLGMFAAGAGAAIPPSGIAMPVRKLWVPPLGLSAIDASWLAKTMEAVQFSSGYTAIQRGWAQPAGPNRGSRMNEKAATPGKVQRLSVSSSPN
jgi:hypothetical protein